MRKQALVIGGGPAGLASSLELQRSGWRVSIIEKRPSYSRPQTLRLDTKSLEFLKKWEISIPEMTIFELEEGGEIHFVPICDLEKGLFKKVASLGIRKIHAEFKKFAPVSQIAIVNVQGKEESFPYDLLVATDGTNSQVKQELEIPCSYFGTALSQVMVLPVIIPPVKVAVSEIQTGLLNMRKLDKPTKVIIHIIQAMAHLQSAVFSLEKLVQVMRASGWELEADLIDSGCANILDSHPVTLRQAKRFTDEQRAALVIGDAAASTSYFQGTGVNTALQAALVVGKFGQREKIDRQTYINFNAEMQVLTDLLIQDSLFLFSDNNQQPVGENGKK